MDLSVQHRSRVCNIGGTLYTRPLNATMEKKFAALAGICDMFVVAFSADLRPHVFSQHARFYLLPRLPVPLLRYLMMVTVGTLLSLWCVLRHGTGVIMAQSPYEGFIGALTKKTARVFGRRVALVVEAFGDFEGAVFLQRRIALPGLYRRAMRLTAGIAIRSADILRAVSGSSTEQLRRWAPDKKILQFPAWTDTGAFLHGDGAQNTGPRGDIIFAGVLIPLKGVADLVSAFATIARDLPAARLVIAGRPQNKVYVRGLRDMVNNAGLGGRVEFLGQVPQSELAALMHRAAVFALPSYTEGLPRVVWEAMAAGLPVVATPVGGIPELVTEGETGFLVAPGDHQALAERLRWVLEHPQEALEMGRRGRAFSERVFSTEVYLQGFKTLLDAAELSRER